MLLHPNTCQYMLLHPNTCQYMPLHELGDHIMEKPITSCIRIGAAMRFGVHPHARVLESTFIS
jgi:hypothetical protein